MNLAEELQARGFVKQFTAESLSSILDTENKIVYHGIDPSADSAHVGNFAIWMLLKHLADHGYKVIFLVGGGTGMIGDPKPDAERVLSDIKEVEFRVEKIRVQAQKLLNNDSVEFVNNYQWLGPLRLIDFLRDIGKHFTVNELVKKDAIAKRLEGEMGLSYTEFAYPLLQAYDYLKLYRDKGCTLQVGGSDQWGNLVAGVDLIRRVERVVVHALTVPLVVDKVTGKKFGKSEGNAVWLDPEKTSPYEFYQFWLNVSDENVVDYLKLFTTLSLENIEEIASEQVATPEKRSAQQVLAREVTDLVHGKELCEQIRRVSTCLFGGVSVKDLSGDELDILKKNAPLTKAEDGVGLVEVLVLTDLAKSKREARMFIESGAVSVNNRKVEVTDVKLTKSNDGEVVFIKKGKKSVSLLELV